MASDIVVCPGMGPSAWDFQKVAADLSIKCCMVPLWGPSVKLSYASHKAVTDYKKAKALGVDTIPVLVGPVSYLLLSKPAKGVEECFSLLSLLGKILPIYKEVITELKEAGAYWIQFDEPTLVMDLESHILHAFTKAYSALESTLSGLNVLIETYFADIPAEQYKTLTSLKGVTAFGFNLVRGTKTLDLIKGDFPEGKYLFAGVVDGRNIWANDLAASLSTLETLEGIVGKDKLVVSTSCSLLHTAVDLVNETKLDKEIKPWLTFPAQKVVEVNALAAQKDEVIFSDNAAALASRKPSPQVIYEAFPAFKFPRHRRATNIHTHMFHSNLIDIRATPTQRLIAARMKEKLDKLSRFKCDHTWGPGQRCGGRKLFRIEAPIGDRDPIHNTEDYSRYLPIEPNEEIGISPPAINRSPKTMNVKMMVNGHVYIGLIDTGSNFNFVRPRVAREAGLNIIKDDPIQVCIADGSIMRSEGRCPEFEFVIQGGQFATQAYILQLGGCDVILGIQWLMGLGPIKNWDFASLKMELTQGAKTIQIIGMDTEDSEAGCSTDEQLLSMVHEGVKYGAGIGPGVYDIHSPRVPSTEEIADGINKMLETILWVNPDRGLKTRKYTGVKPALKNKLLRSQLATAK